MYAHTKSIQNLRTSAFCVSILIMIGTKPRFCLWWLHLTGISSIILYPQCWEFWQKHENTIRWRRPRLASWQGKHLNLLLRENIQKISRATPYLFTVYAQTKKNRERNFLQVSLLSCRVVHISSSTICWSDCKKWRVNVKMMKDCG